MHCGKSNNDFVDQIEKHHVLVDGTGNEVVSGTLPVSIADGIDEDFDYKIILFPRKSETL